METSITLNLCNLLFPNGQYQMGKVTRSLRSCITCTAVTRALFFLTEDCQNFILNVLFTDNCSARQLPHCSYVPEVASALLKADLHEKEKKAYECHSIKLSLSIFQFCGLKCMKVGYLHCTLLSFICFSEAFTCFIIICPLVSNPPWT